MVGSNINADGNRHPIAVLTDGTFDLNTLPGFDVGKATNWYGGTVSGTILTVEDGKDEVSYQYNCGKGVKPTFIFETSLPINEKNFPDPNFRKYIKTYKAGGRDVLTVEEQRKVESIEVKGWNISNLKGIEAFPNLKELNCENNSIQKLDLRQNPELEKLICNKNQLTQLDLSKNPNIYFLNCSWNQLEQLDVSHLKDLVTLDCSHNDLEQLDVKNSKSLVALNCSANQLTELDVDVTHKPNLERVECQNNQLTSLILGQNKLLKKLNCANNQLTQLNLNNMNSLKELKCQNNQLTALDVSSSPNLTTLVLKNNHLTSLNLDSNPHLDFTYTDVYHSDFNNVYTVTLNPDRTFDLNTLPGDFDIKRVTGWVNGTVKGNILTVNEGTNVVYYGYQCRSNMLDVSFTLDVTGTAAPFPRLTPPEPPITPPEPPVTPPSGGVTAAVRSSSWRRLAQWRLALWATACTTMFPAASCKPCCRKAWLHPRTAPRPRCCCGTPQAVPSLPTLRPLPDVADPDTAKAAQWCVEQGLMKRRLNGKFAPGSSIPAYQVLNAYRKLAGG